MTKHLFEWEIREGADEWNDSSLAISFPPVPAHGWSRWRLWWGIVGLVLLAGSGWLWYRAEAGLVQVEQELQVAVEAELWMPEEEDALARLRAKISHEERADAGQKKPFALVQLEVVELGDKWAVVEVISAQGERTYRQTQFYRLDANGWVQTTPTVATWGAPATFESEYFIFHYYAHDAQAVRKAATTLDALASSLVLSYLVETQPHKWVIDVNPEQPIEDESQAEVGNSEILVPSPAVYFSPTEISEDELLAQAVLLKMLDQLSTIAITRHLPDASPGRHAQVQLESLLYSLRLWEVWNTSLPLAALHKPVVQWIYSDTQQNQRPLPEFTPALCDLHHLWGATPFLLSVPLFCGDAQEIDRAQLWRYLNESHRRLDDLSFFGAPTPDEPFGDLASVVGLTMVMDYIGTRYGRAGIADLVVSVPYRNSWETLIPATFGVTRTEFEEGWQAHLLQRYLLETNEGVSSISP